MRRRRVGILLFPPSLGIPAFGSEAQARRGEGRGGGSSKRRTNVHVPHARPAWVFLDILIGILLISIIGVALSTGATWHNRALSHLADSRAATRLAESALISLQFGQHPTDKTIHLVPLRQPTEIPGTTWLEVTATINGRSASLTGLVPTQSLSGAGS
jgi:hypothetical protein